MSSEGLILPALPSASPTTNSERPKRRGNLANLTPWKPGQSGNPRGRERKPLTEKLFNKLVKAGGAEAAVIAQAIIDKAKQGDVPAFIAIADRVEGKPVQRTEGEQSITITIERVGG